MKFYINFSFFYDTVFLKLIKSVELEKDSQGIKNNGGNFGKSKKRFTSSFHPDLRFIIIFGGYGRTPFRALAL